MLLKTHVYADIYKCYYLSIYAEKDLLVPFIPYAIEYYKTIKPVRKVLSYSKAIFLFLLVPHLTFMQPTRIQPSFITKKKEIETSVYVSSVYVYLSVSHATHNEHI